MPITGLTPDTTWMRRCFDLASRGLGCVSPNPPVGAVLVHDNHILGEGYHTRFGGPHAEVEAIRSVPDVLRHLIPSATLYVSLEPCCTHGKTPPCTSLILQAGIRDVRISIQDPNPNVTGKSINILRESGVHVLEGILEDEGRDLIRAFTTVILRHRPHVILKWAQSIHGYTGVEGSQIWLSAPPTSTWTHRQRAESDAILVGARTVESDNPALTAREAPGRSPQRVVYDPSGRLKVHYAVFKDDGCRVYYFARKWNADLDRPYIQQSVLYEDSSHAAQMLKTLHVASIGSLLVEGGSYMHNLFIREKVWDEAWVIQTGHPLDHGIAAPRITGRLLHKVESGTDQIVGILRE